MPRRQTKNKHQSTKNKNAKANEILGTRIYTFPRLPRTTNERDDSYGNKSCRQSCHQQHVTRPRTKHGKSQRTQLFVLPHKSKRALFRFTGCTILFHIFII